VARHSDKKGATSSETRRALPCIPTLYSWGDLHFFHRDLPLVSLYGDPYWSWMSQILGSRIQWLYVSLTSEIHRYTFMESNPQRSYHQAPHFVYAGSKRDSGCKYPNTSDSLVTILHNPIYGNSEDMLQQLFLPDWVLKTWIRLERQHDFWCHQSTSRMVVIVVQIRISEVENFDKVWYVQRDALMYDGSHVAWYVCVVCHSQDAAVLVRVTGALSAYKGSLSKSM